MSINLILDIRIVLQNNWLVQETKLFIYNLEMKKYKNIKEFYPYYLTEHEGNILNFFIL